MAAETHPGRCGPGQCLARGRICSAGGALTGNSSVAVFQGDEQIDGERRVLGGGSSEGASPFVRGAYFVVGGDLLLDLVRRMVRECVGAVDGVAYLVLVAAVSA